MSDPICIGGICDSMGYGAISGVAPYGNGVYGTVGNAMVDVDGTSNVIAYLQMGAPGVPYAGFTTTNSPSVKWHAFLPYANVWIAENGNNNSATSEMTSVWAAMYSGGAQKVLVTNLINTSASSNQWKDLVTQSQPPSPQPNASKATDWQFIEDKRVAGGFFDYYYNFNARKSGGTSLNLAVVDGSAFYATPDGLHDQPVINSLTGLCTVEFRVVLATVTIP